MSLNVELVTKIFLSALCIKMLIQNYLDLRNRRSIVNGSGEVPDQFKKNITIEDHKKAASYSIDQIKLTKVSRLISLVVLLLWTVGGGIEYLNYWVKHFDGGVYYNSILFISFFTLINMLIDLPLSLYKTFVLEEKYGFNKTTPKTFSLDMIKSLFLGIILGLPLFYLMILFVEKSGDFWWFYAWSALTIFQFILMWAYPVFIAPLFNKFTPLESGEHLNAVNELLNQTGFENKGVFIMDASKRSGHGNAYFTGFGKNKRIVFFDTLIETLSPNEIKAVLAHELGHFKRRHVLKNLIVSMIMSLIGFWVLGVCYKSQLFFSGHGVESQLSYLGIVLFMLVSPIYTFFLTPIMSSFSRKHEFEADAFAIENSNGQDLINALLKLYKDNASTLTPDELYSRFYHSHPPAAERVAHIEKCMN